MQFINLKLHDEPIRLLLASVYRCPASDIELNISPPGSEDVGITATVKTDLEGAKRAAKILNAGKG